MIPRDVIDSIFKKKKDSVKIKYIGEFLLNVTCLSNVQNLLTLSHKCIVVVT